MSIQIANTEALIQIKIVKFIYAFSFPSYSRNGGDICFEFIEGIRQLYVGTCSKSVLTFQVQIFKLGSFKQTFSVVINIKWNFFVSLVFAFLVDGFYSVRYYYIFNVLWDLRRGIAFSH